MGVIKTTIMIDENLWKQFSILVIQERGYRMKNKVIEELIRDYCKGKRIKPDRSYGNQPTSTRNV